MRSTLRNFSLLLALLIAATTLFANPAASAQSAVRDFGAESGFVASVNAQRAAGGLGPLTVNGSMSAAADGWTQAMVNGSFLAHAGDIVSGTPGGWSKVGENVGRGQSVSSLTSAFMNSSTHRANIMDPSYTHIGVAVYKHPSDGRIYTTHRFAALGAPPAPVAVAAAQPAPTPIPVVPTAIPVPPTPVPPTPVPVAPTAIPAPPTPVPPTPVPPTPVPEPIVVSDPDFGEPPPLLPFVDDEGTVAQTAATVSSPFYHSPGSPF